jgi:hypothetical protein
MQVYLSSSLKIHCLKKKPYPSSPTYKMNSQRLKEIWVWTKQTASVITFMSSTNDEKLPMDINVKNPAIKAIHPALPCRFHHLLRQ